jgi:hypothetical protein
MSRGFGYAVADCEDTATDEQAMSLAADLALGVARPDHRARCGACRLLGAGSLTCAGSLPAPIPQAVEEWLIGQLPDELESVSGFLLKKAIADYGYEGTGGKDLRARKLLASPGPYSKHFGPFFRRFTVSTDQLIEELLCAGDIQPAHALTLLMHLKAVTVDGKLLTDMSEAPKLGELIEKPDTRRARTECTVGAPDGTEPVAPIQRMIRALWAAFVLDAELRVFEPADEPG